MEQDVSTLVNLPRQRCTLALSEIVVDPAVQSRAALDPETVASYVEDMNDGAEFPPLRVCKDAEGRHWLYGGFHTHRAYATLSVGQVPVEIIIGDKDLAILLSVGENHSHGRPRTIADKHRAVSMLLDHAVWGQWSSRRIADQVRVGHPFVEKLRNQRASEVPSKRTGRDGKVRQVSNSNTSKLDTSLTVKPPGIDNLNGGESGDFELASQLESIPVPFNAETQSNHAAEKPDGNELVISEPASQLATLPVPANAGTSSSAAVEETDEPDQELVCDAYHRPAPPHLVEVFRHMPEYKKLIVTLSKVYNRLDELVRLPAKSGVHIHISSIHKEMTAVKDAIRSGMPHVVCPECDAAQPNLDADVCRRCEGRGWIISARFEQLPRNLKDRAKSYRTVKTPPVARHDDVDAF